MVKLRGRACWRGGQCHGGMQIWWTVLLFLCGFCSETGGDVTIYLTSDVSVTVTEDWSTKIVQSHKVASLTFIKDGSPSSTPPLGQVSKIVSKPSDISTVSEIFATSTAVLTEPHISTLYDDSESTVHVDTTSHYQQSLPMFNSAKDSTGAFSPGEIWDTNTAAVTEQYITTLYQNPGDTKSVDIPIESKTVSSDSFAIPLTKSHSTFKSTLQPSSPLNSQKTNFVTEWSDITSLKDDSPSATLPLGKVSKIVSKPSDFSTVSEIFATSTAFFTEPHIATLHEDSESIVRVDTTWYHQQSLPMFNSAKDSTGAFSPGQIWDTSTAALTEQYITTLYQNPGDTKSVDVPVESKTVSSDSFTIPLTKSLSTFKSTLQPSSPLNSQRTNFVTEWSDVTFLKDSSQSATPPMSQVSRIAIQPSDIRTVSETFATSTAVFTEPHISTLYEDFESIVRVDTSSQHQKSLPVFNSAKDSTGAFNPGEIWDTSTAAVTEQYITTLYQNPGDTKSVDVPVESKTVSSHSFTIPLTKSYLTFKSTLQLSSPLNSQRTNFVTEWSDITSLKDGYPSATLPLGQVSKIVSKPSDIPSVSEIFATSTVIFTEPLISTLHEDSESIVRVYTSSQQQQSLPMFNSAKGSTGAFKSGEIWDTSTAALTEQYITTLYQNPGDTKSVDIPVGSKTVSSDSFAIPLTKSHSTFKSTLQPSSPLNSQTTNFITEWSVVTEILVSTVLDISRDSLQTHLPESATTFLPSRTKTVVPTSRFSSLPDSLQPKPSYKPETYTITDYSVTQPLLEKTLMITSDIVVTELTAPFEMTKSLSHLESASTDMLSSLIYFIETTDLLNSDVETQILSSRSSKPLSMLPSNFATNPDSLSVESTVMLSSLVYITESTDILEPTLPTTILMAPFSSTILSDASPLQKETIFRTNPSYIFETEPIELAETSNVAVTRSSSPVDDSTTLSLVDQSIRTSEEPSMINSEPVGEVSTDMFKTVILTITSDIYYTPLMSPSLATPRWPVMSSVPRSTAIVPTVVSSVPSVIYGTEIITSEIFATISSGITQGLTYSNGLVGSEMSTIFEEPAPTPFLTTMNSVPRSGFSGASSSRQRLAETTLWLTSEIVETTMVSRRKKRMASETFGNSIGSPFLGLSTSFEDVTYQVTESTVQPGFTSSFPSSCCCTSSSSCTCYSPPPSLPSLPIFCSSDGSVQDTVSSEMYFDETLIVTTEFLETTDFLYPSSDIMPTTSRPVYTYTTRTSEIPFSSTPLDKPSLTENLFSSVSQSRNSDFITTVMPTMETSHFLTYPESSRYTGILDTNRGVSPISDISWIYTYEIITTEWDEYITTDLYDSTSTEKYQVSTLFLSPGKPSLQTESTALLVESEEMPQFSFSVFTETSVLPVDTSVITYEMSSVAFTTPETSVSIPITPSMPSVHLTASDGLVTTDFTTLFSEIASTVSGYHPTPSTPSFPSTLLQSLPTFTPMMPSYTQTPGLNTSSVMIHSTFTLETSFSDRSSKDLSSVVTEVFVITDSVLSSLDTPLDYFTDIFVTSEIETIYITDTFPVTMSSIEEYFTVVIDSSDTYEPSYSTGPIVETRSTQVVESRTSETIPLFTPLDSLQMSSPHPATMSSIEDSFTVVITSSDTFEPSYSTGPPVESTSTQVVEPRTSKTISLPTPLESLQISGQHTIMYTTILDTVFTSTLITSFASTSEYSSSVLTVPPTPSSEKPEISISEIYDTVSLATTDFVSSVVPSITAVDVLTSSVDMMPIRSSATIRTSFVPTAETSVGSSPFAETLSTVTPTSEVEKIISTTISMDGPILSSFDTYSTRVLSGSYDSVISPSFTTPLLSMSSPTSPVSEKDMVTDEVTPTTVSSTYAAVESSAAISLIVTDIVSLSSVVLSSDIYPPTFLIPSPSDSLIMESSASLATLSETPPLTSLPTYATSSLLQTVPPPSAELSDMTPTLAASFSVSEELMSSSVAAQGTTSLIWSTASQMATPSIPSAIPTFAASFAVSEELLSSSAAAQKTTSLIWSTASKMVTPSTPSTLLPVTTTTELPVEVPEEFQLMMDIKVPTSEDITTEEFSQTLSNNLAILYIEGESNVLQRRRRSSREGDTPTRDKTDQEWIFTRTQQSGIGDEENILQTQRRINTGVDTSPGDPENQEWIFSRKPQSGESRRTVQHLEPKEQNLLTEESLYDGPAKESSAEMEWMFVSKQIGRTSPVIKVGRKDRVRRKRQADPSDETEVPILALTRSDDTDPETVSVTFYVMDNDTLVLATDAAATYNTLTEGEMSAQLGYAVRSVPSPVIPIPSTTPDYPYTIPPAEQSDWLKMTLILDVAFDVTNATFQKQLRNDLEFLYVNGSDGLETITGRKRRDLSGMLGWTRRYMARNIGTTARDVGRGNPSPGDIILESDLVRERRAADPSSATEVALQSVNRTQASGEEADVLFYVIDEGLVVPGALALVPYQQFTLQELYDVIGYVVVSPGVTLYLTATPAGLAWWWYLLIALIALLLIIVIVLLIYYYCWSKKTAVKSLNKVDRSTSVELGFLRLDKEPKAKLVVMETVLDEKPSKRSQVNGSASHEADQERLTEEAVQKRKKKKRSKRAQESTREYAKRGYLSGEDDQLFSHVDAHASKPKSKKATSTTARLQNNAVYPQAERLPPLKHRSLVAYSETDSEISSEQLRMMRKAGVPKSWYTTHIDKDPEELKKDIAREKKRQRKKEKKLQDQLTAEQMQKEFDKVLGGADEQGIKNPTARHLQATRTDRWKPKDTRKSEIPDSTGIIDESAVRLIRTRPLESAAPPAPNHEDIKKEIEELLKRGPPKPVKGPLSKAPSVSEEEAKELAEKKEREVRLRRKWTEERKRLNRILDEAFALTSTSLGSSSEQPTGDTPTASNGHSVAGDREFHKDLDDSGYLRHRGYYGYDALDDTSLPGMIPARLTVSPRSIPFYETSIGLDLSGEHLYDSIRRPPIEYEFLPSQMRSDGEAPAYGVSISPVRTQRAPRVAPYPPRDVLTPTDPYRSLNSSLNSSLQPMQITPRNHHPDRTIATGHQRQNRNSDEGSEQDIIRVQEENLSLQRLVAQQQRELDHALALIGQPNSRIGQSEKSENKEGKVGSNGRKQRRVVPVNSTKPLSGPDTMSAWTDDHKAVERTSHPLTSTPHKDNLTKAKPRPSSVVLEHHIEKPGKGATNGKEKAPRT